MAFQAAARGAFQEAYKKAKKKSQTIQKSKQVVKN
jgi:hypothetical protein